MIGFASAQYDWTNVTEYFVRQLKFMLNLNKMAWTLLHQIFETSSNLFPEFSMKLKYLGVKIRPITSIPTVVDEQNKSGSRLQIY